MLHPSPASEGRIPIPPESGHVPILRLVTFVCVLALMCATALATVLGCASSQARPAATSPLPVVDSDTTPGPADSAHLTVRLDHLDAAARNATAGVQILDTNPRVYLYVPPHCVGTRRVPLLLLLHGSGGSALELLTDFQHFADARGLLILAVQSVDPEGWSFSATEHTPDATHVDLAVRQVLAHYAVDPRRLALLGFSAGAGMALDLGYVNGDVFRHILAFSPFIDATEFDNLPQHGRPAVYIGYGQAENEPEMLRAAQMLTERGDTTVTQDFPGGHTIDELRASAGLAWLMARWK